MVSAVNKNIDKQKDNIFICNIDSDMNSDKKKYLEYKNGNIKTDSLDEILNLITLKLLEENGFHIDDIGTYLYRDIIINIIKRLNSEHPNIEELKEELSNTYSQFYFDISRNERDMGVKTFHFYIKKAILNIKDENKTSNLLDKMCFQRKIDYGQLAYEIACYIMKNNSLQSDLKIISEINYNIKKLTINNI